MKKFIEKAAVLVEALPYIQDFKGAVVLVKVGGSVMEVPENLESLLTDIAFLNAVGIKTVLVHGGGKAISRGMESAGIPPHFVMGLRVTTEEAVRVVERVIKNEVNANVVRLLQKHLANARPLHGDWIFGVAKKTGRNPETGEALDWGYVGEPVSVDTRPVAETQTRVRRREMRFLVKYCCARSPSRSFSAIRSRRLFGASTFTSGIQDRTQRTSSLRPVVSIRISTQPSARVRNSCVGCHCRSVM